MVLPLTIEPGITPLAVGFLLYQLFSKGPVSETELLSVLVPLFFLTFTALLVLLKPFFFLLPRKPFSRCFPGYSVAPPTFHCFQRLASGFSPSLALPLRARGCRSHPVGVQVGGGANTGLNTATREDWRLHICALECIRRALLLKHRITQANVSRR